MSFMSLFRILTVRCEFSTTKSWKDPQGILSFARRSLQDILRFMSPSYYTLDHQRSRHLAILSETSDLYRGLGKKFRWSQFRMGEKETTYT